MVESTDGETPMTRARWLLVAGCLAAAVLPARAQSTVQNFTPNTGSPFVLQNFSGDAPMVLTGGPSGEFLRLAYAEVGNTQNVITFDRTQAGNIREVTASFDFRIGGTTNFADGMGFALLNTANFGTTGNIPDFFSEEPWLTGSFGLGLDTFNNGGLDRNNNHVSIHYL